MRRRVRFKGEAGIGLVEASFGLLILVITLVTLASTLTVASGRTLERLRRDDVTAMAYSLQDTARAMNCGAFTGNEPEAILSASATQCAQALNATRLNENFTFTSRYWWELNSPPAGLESAGGACDALLPARYTPQPRILIPDTLHREFTVSWQEGRVTPMTRTISFRDVLPPNLRPVNTAFLGSIVLQNAEPGTVYEIRRSGVNPNTPPIQRAADPNGCVWFPMLQLGEWQVNRESASGGEVVVLTAGNRNVLIGAGF